jgi:rhodanese-related sulfurtransferase
MNRFFQLLLSGLALLFSLQAFAIDLEQVPAKKRSASGLHLIATEAAAMKNELGPKVLLIDIRTRAEAMYVGVADIEKRLAAKDLTKDDPVIIMCRSGARSSLAAGLLAQNGFKKAYTVIDGFEGDTAKEGPQKGQRVVNSWKNAGLPWSYKMKKEKMYLDPL